MLSETEKITNMEIKSQRIQKTSQNKKRIRTTCIRHHPHQRHQQVYLKSSQSSSSSRPSYQDISAKHTALIRGLLFIVGFSVVFVALGASITALGALFFDYGRWIEIIGGILLVVFGLHLLGVLRIPGTEREWKFHFSKRPVAGHIGFFYNRNGFWSRLNSVIGPILASILAIVALVHHYQQELRC